MFSSSIQQAANLLPDANTTNTPSTHVTLPPLPPSPCVTNFVMLYSGHSGSSAINDMLSRIPGVLVPGFEPLDTKTASPEAKLSFLTHVFSPPSPPAPSALCPVAPSSSSQSSNTSHIHTASLTAAASTALTRQWVHKLVDAPAGGLRLNKTRIRIAMQPSQLQGLRAIGFKMRPYTGRDLNATHTAMSGLDPHQVRELFDHRAVQVIAITRHDSFRQALSWYKAREAGLRQFEPELARAGGPITVNASKLENYRRFSMRTNSEILRAAEFFAANQGSKFLHVVYEDFQRDNGAVFSRIVDYLGLGDLEKGGVGMPPTKFHKIASDDLSEEIANLYEVCAFYANKGVRVDALEPYCL